MTLYRSKFGVTVMENIMVPMRDGVRLATDVYFPVEQNGKNSEWPLPVILERTPYNKRSPDRIEKNCRYFAERGYIFVMQDCRACYQSEGEFGFFWQEGPDGLDTMTWITEQEWCNGSIGTTGTSYAGWTQNSLAVLDPPGLKCMWVNEGASNGYTSTLRHGGALELRFLTWLYWHAAMNDNAGLKNTEAAVKSLAKSDTREILKQLPIKRGQTPLAHAPAYEELAIKLLSSGDYDETWKDPSVNFQIHWDQFADVPTVFSSAWYDSYTRANIENYVGLSSRKKGPFRLIMGPWTHGDGSMGNTYSGGIDLGPEAPIDYNFERLRWFDHWLKNIDNGVDMDPKVRIFIMGGGDGNKNREDRLNHGGYWVETEKWPLDRSDIYKLYLNSEGSLDSNKPRIKDSFSTYVFDPKDPVPSIGGNVSSLATLRPIPSFISDASQLPQSYRVEQIVLAGGWDQREAKNVYGAKPPYNEPLGARQDVLVFKTVPLADDLKLTGSIEVTMWVSSDAPDTDFTAKLIDLYPPSIDYPDGFALNISDSIFRMRYRDSWERPSDMKPGLIYPITIVMYPSANIFVKGHSIRLDISSSNFPRFDVNPNTGEPLGRNTHTRIAANTVYHDSRYPSHLKIEVSDI